MSASSSSTPIRKPEKIILPTATDERCWIKCRQTNAGRVRRADPRCSMFCYYSNKIPTLPILPPPELLPTISTTTTEEKQNEKPLIENESLDLEEKRASLIERYTIPFLKGKFLYFAIGKPAINKHLMSMRRIHSIEHNWIYEKLKEETNEDHHHLSFEEKTKIEKSNRGLVVLSYHRDYEKTINISYSIASIFVSIHLHFEKLYKPTYQILTKLPNSIKDL
ncbi:hypothetical protein CROQUDRAFT_30686, partial [Cronartium quercuum f. sp. fusiforme G11]